jgi:hypothetical protein
MLKYSYNKINKIVNAYAVKTYRAMEVYSYLYNSALKRIKGNWIKQFSLSEVCSATDLVLLT